MNKKLIAIGAVSAIAIAVIATLGAVSTYAYQGDYTQHGPNYTPEREVAVESVMDKKDYNGWKTLMTEDGRTPGVLRKVDTQDKFNKFADAYLLAEAGKTAEATALRTELGLGMGNGTGTGNSTGRRGGNGSCGNM